MAGSPWFRRLTRSRADRTIFVFPPAGAGATLFRSWPEVAPSTIGIVAVTAPGREHRISEPPFQHVGPLADAIAGHLEAQADGPFLLFGHSAGALIGREVAKRIAGAFFKHLVVAGAEPPDASGRDLRNAGEAELLAAMRAWGGTPQQILDDPTIAEVFLPCLRADLAVAHSCRTVPSKDELLNRPITALVGSDDRFATSARVAGWARWTTSAFSLEVVRGAHFFPVTAGRAVVQLLASLLSEGPPVGGDHPTADVMADRARRLDAGQDGMS
jgi:surfactin synthase thioesterase subunit